MKVYSPNGKELSIHAKKLNECPLCHESSLIIKNSDDVEDIDCFCSDCHLSFSYFPLRKFIKLRGFYE